MVRGGYLGITDQQAFASSGPSSLFIGQTDSTGSSLSAPLWGLCCLFWLSLEFCRGFLLSLVIPVIPRGLGLGSLTVWEKSDVAELWALSTACICGVGGAALALGSETR